MCSPDLTMVKKKRPTEPSFHFYSCHVCSYRTKFASVLRQHFSNHYISKKQFCCNEPPLDYSCDECKFSTDLWVLFSRHSTEDRGRFACSRCNFSSFSALIMLSHATKCKHVDTPQTEYMKCAKFLREIMRHKFEWLKCDQCSNIWGLKSVPFFERHLKMHLDKWNTYLECGSCFFNVQQVAQLRHHVLLEHGDNVT